MNLHKELKQLNRTYKLLEKNSVQYDYSDNEYLAIRLDGVKFTSKYIRSNFIPNFMNSMITDSVFETYKVMFNKHENNLKNFIVCIVQVNDEVTFVLNKGDNKYNRRIMKLASLISGMMSSWSTHIVRNKPIKNVFNKTDVEYYDARPIILNDVNHIYDYVRYRYLTAKKHALAKTLKFNGVNIKPYVWENIIVSYKKVVEKELQSEYQKIENTFHVYIPNDSYNLKMLTLNQSVIDYDLKKMIIESERQQCLYASNTPHIQQHISMQ